MAHMALAPVMLAACLSSPWTIIYSVSIPWTPLPSAHPPLSPFSFFVLFFSFCRPLSCVFSRFFAPSCVFLGVAFLLVTCLVRAFSAVRPSTYAAFSPPFSTFLACSACFFICAAFSANWFALWRFHFWGSTFQLVWFFSTNSYLLLCHGLVSS